MQKWIVYYLSDPNPTEGFSRPTQSENIKNKG